ncbi:MAG: hypothetical protein ACFFD2_13075 [Promethearchaeota archaeon]
MGTVKVVGGILALAGGAMVLILCLLIANLYLAGSMEMLLNWIVNFIIAILAIIGSLMGIAGKKVGGILAFIAGLWWTIFGILISANIISMFSSIGMILLPASLIGYYLVPLPYITIEGILCILGGLLLLAGSSD